MGSEAGIVPLGAALLVGLGLLSLVAALPFIDFSVTNIAVLYGLGTIYDRALEYRAASRAVL